MKRDLALQAIGSNQLYIHPKLGAAEDKESEIKLI